MKINKDAKLIGTDGTEVTVLSHVSNRGGCVVRIEKLGSMIGDKSNHLRKGSVVKGFDVYHGLVKFYVKGSGVKYTDINTQEQLAA